MINFQSIFNFSIFKEKKQRGFTLVEVLITLNIFIFIFVTCFAVYFLAQKFYQKAENRAETLQNVRIILERLNREIRQAVEIVSALPHRPICRAIRLCLKLNLKMVIPPHLLLI